MLKPKREPGRRLSLEMGCLAGPPATDPPGTAGFFGESNEGMTTTLTGTHYLGRQPILDRTQNLTGFELELRPADPRGANHADEAVSLLRYAFTELGADSVLGRHKGAVNLTPDLLMSDAVDRLPKERVMLNLVGPEGLTPAVVARCRALKAQGFSLALEADTLNTTPGAQLLPLAHVLKVDVSRFSGERARGMVSMLKPSGRRLLATGVETPQQARECLEIGFDYLQGHFFSRPEVVPGRKLDHGQMALMGLLGLVMSDADLDDIVDAFKHYPDISLQLLRLANSAAVGARTPSTTIAQAISIMGRNHLLRWLQVLMFSTGGVPGVEFPSPLLIQASTRGKLMELLSRDLWQADRGQQDRAFMGGMLSLLGAQFSIEIDELIADLPLDEDLRLALLDRAGNLGVLLFLVETLEQPGFMDMQMALDGIGMVDPDLLMTQQVAAMKWANTLDTGAPRKGSL